MAGPDFHGWFWKYYQSLSAAPTDKDVYPFKSDEAVEVTDEEKKLLAQPIGKNIGAVPIRENHKEMKERASCHSCKWGVVGTLSAALWWLVGWWTP
jgi:hypothetical protein